MSGDLTVNNLKQWLFHHIQDSLATVTVSGMASRHHVPAELARSLFDRLGREHPSLFTTTYAVTGCSDDGILRVMTVVDTDSAKSKLRSVRGVCIHSIGPKRGRLRHDPEPVAVNECGYAPPVMRPPPLPLRRPSSPDSRVGEPGISSKELHQSKKRLAPDRNHGNTKAKRWKTGDIFTCVGDFDGVSLDLVNDAQDISDCTKPGTAQERLSSVGETLMTDVIASHHPPALACPEEPFVIQDTQRNSDDSIDRNTGCPISLSIPGPVAIDARVTTGAIDLTALHAPRECSSILINDTQSTRPPLALQASSVSPLEDDIIVIEDNRPRPLLVPCQSAPLIIGPSRDRNPKRQPSLPMEVPDFGVGTFQRSPSHPGPSQFTTLRRTTTLRDAFQPGEFKALRRPLKRTGSTSSTASRASSLRSSRSVRKQSEVQEEKGGGLFKFFKKKG